MIYNPQDFFAPTGFGIAGPKNSIFLAKGSGEFSGTTYPQYASWLINTGLLEKTPAPLSSTGTWVFRVNLVQDYTTTTWIKPDGTTKTGPLASYLNGWDPDPAQQSIPLFSNLVFKWTWATPETGFNSVMMKIGPIVGIAITAVATAGLVSGIIAGLAPAAVTVADAAPSGTLAADTGTYTFGAFTTPFTDIATTPVTDAIIEGSNLGGSIISSVGTAGKIATNVAGTAGTLAKTVQTLTGPAAKKPALDLTNTPAPGLGAGGLLGLGLIGGAALLLLL